MTGARHTLEYRAAADDRRRRDGRVWRWVLRLILAGIVVLLAYIFLLSVLGGIVLLVSSFVLPSFKLGLVAVGLLFASGLNFYLMFRLARVLDRHGAAPQ